VRELAAFYVVNPNTVQRALSELERDGLLSSFSKRASGKMVTEDQEMIKELRSRLATERIEALLAAMESLGFSAGETRDLFDDALRTRQSRTATAETAQKEGTEV
jgi:DNA-binding transcriptional regulator YhcF (GntR family)